MKVETYEDLRPGETFDFVVVGSGFGGSVSALRLREKGWSVAVLEAGRYYRDQDYPRSDWRLDKFLWLPRLFCFGIQRLTLLKDLLILSGAGVGGGSLVYANTLLEPGEDFYASSACRRLDPGLRSRLKPYYALARRMLGAAANPRTGEPDRILAECAEELGRGGTVHSVTAGVYFGEPGVERPDPYFGGKGPPRSGCLHCGACMVGCRHNAKNTLVKNYLYLAQALGARIFSLCQVRRIEELGDEGFELELTRPGWRPGRKTVRARHLVLSAGVLGTLRLLLEPSNRLRLPDGVGRGVRSNSEVLLGAMTRRADLDCSKGLAITSGFYPDDKTHVELVRYPEGSDAMGLLSLRQVPGATAAARLWGLFRESLRRPGDLRRLWWPFGWARRTLIFLVMQPEESRLELRLERLWGFGGRRLASSRGSLPPPLAIPAADEVLRRYCEKTDSIPLTTLNGGLLGVATTAHILGGAVMGPRPGEGVVGLDGRVFGHRRLWVLDGSIIPANLGVNPSLTITALAEHAMSLAPAKAP